MEITQIIIEKTRRINTNDCYIILFDIDRFKSINDNYGHIIGDKVLIDVTSRIKTTIRPYDLFARYGGEEFIMFISDLTRENMIEMAERLRLCLCGKKFEYDNLTLEVSASFGIVYLEDYNIERAMVCADEAMYTAKRTGRNKVIFYEDISKLH